MGRQSELSAVCLSDYRGGGGVGRAAGFLLFCAAPASRSIEL